MAEQTQSIGYQANLKPLSITQDMGVRAPKAKNSTIAAPVKGPADNKWDTIGRLITDTSRLVATVSKEYNDNEDRKFKDTVTAMKHKIGANRTANDAAAASGDAKTLEYNTLENKATEYSGGVEALYTQFGLSDDNNEDLDKKNYINTMFAPSIAKDLKALDANRLVSSGEQIEKSLMSETTAILQGSVEEYGNILDMKQQRKDFLSSPEAIAYFKATNATTEQQKDFYYQSVSNSLEAIGDNVTGLEHLKSSMDDTIGDNPEENPNITPGFMQLYGKVSMKVKQIKSNRQATANKASTEDKKKAKDEWIGIQENYNIEPSISNTPLMGGVGYNVVDMDFDSFMEHADQPIPAVREVLTRAGYGENAILKAEKEYKEDYYYNEFAKEVDEGLFQGVTPNLNMVGDTKVSGILEKRAIKKIEEAYENNYLGVLEANYNNNPNLVKQVMGRDLTTKVHSLLKIEDPIKREEAVKAMNGYVSQLGVMRPVVELKEKALLDVLSFDSSPEGVKRAIELVNSDLTKLPQVSAKIEEYADFMEDMTPGDRTEAHRLLSLYSNINNQATPEQVVEAVEQQLEERQVGDTKLTKKALDKLGGNKELLLETFKDYNRGIEDAEGTLDYNPSTNSLTLWDYKDGVRFNKGSVPMDDKFNRHTRNKALNEKLKDSREKNLQIEGLGRRENLWNMFTGTYVPGKGFMGAKEYEKYNNNK